MYRYLSRLVLYRNFGDDGIIQTFSDCLRKLKQTDITERPDLVNRIYGGIHALLDLATMYGFDRNLWRDYLTYLLLTNENSLSLTAEKKGIEDGTVRQFALQDMKIFAELFVYDFSTVEKTLGIDCFSTITHYQAIEKRAQNYNRNVSLRVRETSDAISRVLEECGAGADGMAAERMLDILANFYRDYGVGMLGLNRAFRLKEQETGLAFEPINNIEDVRLSDLVGYEIQKQKLRENTEAFLRGHRANNCLLFGDAGTGKSTSIKALIAEYYDQGLRMIELYKHQMQSLSQVISTVKHRNYKFIIYMDDLSFEDHETEYKYLKAVIEGGLENRPDNVLIYATSNRRNLIRESWNDTADVDLEKHRGDTLQEKLSLVDRFGIKIPYMKPNKKEYVQIVEELAKRVPGLAIDPEKLQREAAKWEVSHGGMSGRTAQQFIDYMAGQNL
ncbi:MAG: ATP-binding protein [Eubacterium sp.]|nr:ATP-binding protein [Eubacterium sp.]